MKVENFTSAINFGTSYRKVKSKTYTLGDCYEASTYFYVEDLEWNKFFNHIIKKYENTPKVNIYSLASSDGSEAYSIAMLLISKLGEKSDKYFPIIAVDFDAEITKMAKNGYINLSADDEVRINKYTGNKLSTFFERTTKTTMSNKIGSTDRQELLTEFKIKPILKDKVIFVTEDINEYIEKIPSENNLIFCRNCWPYLWKTRFEFAEKISNKCDRNSYLITGNYDKLVCPMHEKNCYGFSMSPDFTNVFDKTGSNYFYHPDLYFLRNTAVDDI